MTDEIKLNCTFENVTAFALPHQTVLSVDFPETDSVFSFTRGEGEVSLLMKNVVIMPMDYLSKRQLKAIERKSRERLQRYLAEEGAT